MRPRPAAQDDTEEEWKARDATYAAPLKVSVRLRNKETEEIKEQEINIVYFTIVTLSSTSGRDSA